LHIEGKAFTLRLRAGLHCKFDGAGDLVRVDNLKALLGSLWILRGNHGSEPEDVLLHGEEAGADDGLSVEGWVERWNHSLLFEDLIEVK